MAATKGRLYPSLDEVSGKRKCPSGKENLPVTPAKRAKIHGTPVRAPPKPAEVALQSKIELEYKIRDGAVKLLQASKNTRQSMEASKGLFVSNAKILALMREMQQRKEHTHSLKSDQDKAPCKARIAISDIRIPLEWRDLDSSKTKTESHFGVFCLFKIGNQVMDSSSLVSVDRTTMDIVFREPVIFPEMVGPDFCLEVEVYCSVPVEESSAKPSTPIKMLKKLRSKAHDKVEGSPAPQSTVPSSPYTPHAPSITPSHRFVVAGHSHLTIKDVSNSCRTYLLKRGPVGASGTAATSTELCPLPLWGQLCCTLMSQPACATGVRRDGFVNLQRMVGGLPDWTRLWCVLRQNHLRYWNSPEDIGKKDLVYQFDLTKTMTVELAPRLSIRRPNALLLKDSSSEVFVAFESKEERAEWMDTIKQAVLDLSVWKSSCEFVIPVPQSKFYTESPDKGPELIDWHSTAGSDRGQRGKSETTL